MKKKILIFSAGPMGRETRQLILNINKLKNEWELIGYVDNNLKKKFKTIDNVKVYSEDDKPKNKDIYGVSVAADFKTREKILKNQIIKNNYKITNLIHPSVYIPKCIKLGEGNIIFGNIHLSFEVNIKNFVILSTFCDIGHNLIINDFATVMPSVTIGGNVKIGKNTFIGSGARIHQGINVGENCIIGMGSVITKNIKNNTSVVDHPRKVVTDIK